MEFQVARLQEIITKIQFFSKLHFKNAIDVSILLETEGIDIADINKLIGAGVRKIGFSSLEQFSELEYLLFPCEKYYLGELDDQNLGPILANFAVIESLTNLEQARQISDINARTGRVTKVLMRLNILSDIKKFGFLPVGINDSSYEVALMSGLRLVGISSYVPKINEELQKTAWRKAATVYKMMSERLRGLEYFSMNYADNLAELIAEGVNEIRIGVKTLA